MSRSALKTLAVILGILIVIVLFAGLDDLPRSVRAQIDSERRAFAEAQTRFKAAREEVTRDLQSDPQLFAAIASSRAWPGELDRAEAQLQTASRETDELARLEKQNRRQDRARAESLLAAQRRDRTAALAAAAAVQKEAARWVNLRRDLPQRLQEMERQHVAIDGFDLNALGAAVEKAGNDWPEKKADLESRLAGVRGIVSQADISWDSSAGARRDAAAGDLARIGTVAATADILQTSADALPKQAGELKSLTGQLYGSWDKILVDMEVRGIGNDRSYDQQIRTVRTQVADASGKDSTTTSEEKWVDVPRATYEAMKNNLGMAIEHKPAGKYDLEAERVAQPAGFAYVAPYSQGSNQYGRWEHRDGRDFWVFYGQYALLRDLLFNRDYRPLDRGDWEGYRTSQQRGQTYYGRDEAAGAPKYGSQGTATQNRYSGSTYARSGGFRDSQYASKSGSYRDSQYASPAARDRNADPGAKRFGRNAEQPHAAPPPSRSYRPAPSPSFRPPSRSPGRSFGRRR
jgi:hypothetical protein